MEKIKYVLCRKCDYYVNSSKTKSYCENGYWDNVDIDQSKLFNPLMFECAEFEKSED